MRCCFFVGQAIGGRPAGDPLVALRPSGTRASRADLGVCPTRIALVFIALAVSGSLRADLTKARGESNLEKRSQLALENAAVEYRAARDAYNKGDNQQTATAIGEIQESVTLAVTSLRQTGKDPRKSPKYFKKAEIETRDLLRKLEGFQQEMGYEDRPMLEKLKENVQQAHEELLLGLMEGKKRK